MKRYLLPLILILVLIFSINCFATPWDVSTAVYANKYKIISGQETSPYSLTFKITGVPVSNGTKLYFVGGQNRTVYQWTISNWNVGTGSYDNKYKDVAPETSTPYDVVFNSDGTKMYVLGYTNDAVYQYTLSTAWDVSTATYAEKSVSVEDQDITPQGVSFNSDGTKMYILGQYNSTVYQYTLSTGWDVSTATYADKSVGVQAAPDGFYFKPDGTKMYILTNSDPDRVYQYSLSTGWDVSTATYDNKSKDVSAQEHFFSEDVFFSSGGVRDGVYMYIVGTANDTVWQYYLPPAPPTNVQATDGVHIDKVVITWTKSAGANQYQVYRDDTPLGWLGDVATYDDTGADAPTITHGSITASDGSSTAHTALSNTGESANNGTTHVYKVKAKILDDVSNPESGYSETNNGYRGVGSLTYLWYKSAGDTPVDYSSIDGATTDPYNDTAAPAPTITVGTASASDGTKLDYVILSISGESANIGAGRYYKCYHTATGVTPGFTGVDRGYRDVGSLTYQWQRSAGDSDAEYSNIDGATTDPYNDTGAPEEGEGRYYKCIENATGATEQTTNADRGYRYTGKVDSFFFGTNL